MPTFSNLDIHKLDQALEDVHTLIDMADCPDDFNDIIEVIALVRDAYVSAENPDGTMPFDLQPGDMVELDVNDWVEVTGAPWTTDEGRESLSSVVAVPSFDRILFLPAHVKVAVR